MTGLGIVLRILKVFRSEKILPSQKQLNLYIPKYFMKQSSKNGKIKTFSLILFILLSTPCFACSCIGKSTIKKALKNSDVVFTGTVLSSEKVKVQLDSTFTNDQMEYTFLVTKRLKGKFVNDTIKIYSGFGGGDCGFKFKTGETYIVYSKYDEYTLWGKADFLFTGICDRTKLYDEKEAAKIERYMGRKQRSKFAGVRLSL